MSELHAHCSHPEEYYQDKTEAVVSRPAHKKVSNLYQIYERMGHFKIYFSNICKTKFIMLVSVKIKESNSNYFFLLYNTRENTLKMLVIRTIMMI